ncbi:MAG TPA: aminotransferase class IV, partial [Chitinophagaceae bacterium]|nr:aminotransferase class IV [Chitinophagaceae bacterium]
FRTVDHRPLFLDDYLDRFSNSLKELRLDIGMGRDKLHSLVHELIAINNIADSGIRLLATGGYSPDSYQPAAPNFIITQQPLKPRSADAIENGLRVISHEYVRDLPHVKSLNYLMAIWLQEKVRNAGASDVLYHLDGEVSEFARSNFFIVTQDDEIRTPSENILRGITRKKTIELACRHFKVTEGKVTLTDLRTAKEAFMTSTMRQILPIVQVDGIAVGTGKPGAITRFLDEQFTRFIQPVLT